MYKEKMSKLAAVAGRGLAKRGVNEACILWFYQPTVPQGVKDKLRKI